MVPVPEADKLTVPVPHLAALVPVGADGTAFTVTAKVLAALVPHELVAVTETFPFCPDAPTVTVIEFVPVPAVIDQPVGTVHV